MLVQVSVAHVSSLFSSFTLTKHSGNIWVKRSKLESSSPVWTPPFFPEVLVVAEVDVTAEVVVVVLVVLVSVEVSVPMKGSMLLHHCIVYNPTQ